MAEPDTWQMQKNLNRLNINLFNFNLSRPWRTAVSAGRRARPGVQLCPLAAVPGPGSRDFFFPPFQGPAGYRVHFTPGWIHSGSIVQITTRLEAPPVLVAALRCLACYGQSPSPGFPTDTLRHPCMVARFAGCAGGNDERLPRDHPGSATDMWTQTI